MFELPLFPLHSVLFPGMPLYLHIFEERYKRMIRLCLETHQPFGVVLIRKGLEAFGPLAEPHAVGCLARIIKNEELPGGRMNITAVGEERFHLLELLSAREPYLVGEVEPFPLQITDPRQFASIVSRLRPLIERYLQLLTRTGSVQMELKDFSKEPQAFVFAAAVLLQTSPEVKQELLATQDGFELAGRLRKVYLRETALLRALLDRGGSEEEKIFSRN
jgi:Lon protease-like protein